MNCAQYLKELLRPLGVYDLSAPFNGGELESAGAALDEAQDCLEEIARESSLSTAAGWGLEAVANLLEWRPVAEGAAAMGEALAALLRIGSDSFTLRAMNDTLSGCGIPAQAEESDVGAVAVSFPGVGGVPAEFEELKKRVEAILPAHVAIDYKFRYLLWQELEQSFPTWQELEASGFSWSELETYICAAA